MLAHLGLGSRREIEEWIRNGKVRINGHLARLGDRLRRNDQVQLDGRVVNLDERTKVPTRLLIYHKPIGEVVSRRDPQGRPVIFTQLPKLRKGRWITVGRLDINTQGLLLVTNNGGLAHRLMHPAQQLEREYAVRVFGNVPDEVLNRLRQGVELEDGFARFESIEPAGGEGINKWFKVILKEGRNRIVRRLWESQGITVSRLIRIRFGSVLLPERLKARTFYELSEQELATLMEWVGLRPEIKAALPRPVKKSHRKR